MNFAEMLQNPRSIALKNFMAQAIQHKVINYDDLLTRIGSVLITDNDIKMFGYLINDVLAAGYQKALDDYKSQLEKMGIEITVKKN